MDALQRRSVGMIHLLACALPWTCVGLLLFGMGCKVGNPLDRTVRVTQEPTLDPANVPTPRTRLASSSLDRMKKNASELETEESPHVRSGKAETTAVARKTPAATSTKYNLPSDTNGSVIKQVSQEEVVATPPKNLSKEHAELLNAFRDSSPEVQQQALRQLLAVSGRPTAKTQSPESISAALMSTVSSLPTLPEDAPESDTVPSRLGNGNTKTQDTPKVQTAVAQADIEQNWRHIQQAGGDSNDSEKSGALSAIKDIPSDAIAIQDAQNASGKPLSSVSTGQLYEELVSRLEQPTAGESDADRYRRQIVARHLMLFNGNPDAAVEKFDGMSATEEEFLRHHLLAVWAMVDTSGHPVSARRWSAALPELRLATQKLSGATELLDVRSLAFCKEIQSFGQVTKFESDHFAPAQKVILYCEIDNFLAQSTSEGFETHLQGSYEIFNSQGQKVAGQVLPADKQLCANYLRDYFIAYQMSLPASLEPGEYRLELTMECLKGQKYGQASLPLTITAAR